MTLVESAPEVRAANREAIPDEEVVRRVRGGETALYETIMRRYNQRLYRVPRSILRSESEAEDVMQETYVRAFTHLDQFAGRASFSTWLTRIAINEALARVRRQGRYEAFDDEGANVEALMDPNPSENPERLAFTGELRGLIEWAIDSLPNGTREVFVLREVEGLSTLEVAACLGDRASGAMRCIAGGCLAQVAQPPTHVHRLVAGECPAAAAVLRIQEVHERGACHRAQHDVQ